MAKKAQLIMIWFLPLIVVGGLFFPLLGYIVLAMMIFFLTLSAFKGRYWCGHLCPRGAFLDIVLSKASRNKSFPKFFPTKWFRWLMLISFMGFFIYRIVRVGGSLFAIGAVFVSMCLITTIISIVLGVATKYRGWCVICPMGTLQDKIYKIVTSISKNKN